MSVTKEVEENLAPLVYTRLQDEIPELFDFILGFQLVESQDNGAKNLGILALNVYNKHYYIPIFFLGGNLKPMVHLFDYAKNLFIALTPKRVEYLKKPPVNPDVQLHENDKHLEATSRPNLHDFAISPVLSKTANMNRSIYATVIPKMVKKAERQFNFYNTLQYSDRDVKKVFCKMLSKNAHLAEQVQLHFPLFMEKLAFSVDEMEKQEKIPELVIKTKPMEQNSPEENHKLMDGQVIVEDNRKGHSIVSMKEDCKTYGGANENGLYMVLDNNGEWVPRVILLNSTCDDGRREFTEDVRSHYDDCVRNVHGYSIIDVEKREFQAPAKQQQFITRQEVKSLKPFWEKTIPVSEMKVGKKYVIMSPEIMERQTGCFCEPSEIQNKYISAKSNIVTYKTYDKSIKVRPEGCCVMDWVGPDRDLIVSPDARAFEIKEQRYHCDCLYGKPEDLENYLYNSRVDTINLYEKEAMLHIGKKGYVTFSGTPNETKVHLMVNYGMDEPTTDNVIQKQGSWYIFKKATNITPYEEPYIEVDNGILPSDERYPSTDHVALNPLVPEKEPASTFEDDIYMLGQAMQSGEQEIMDSALVGILAKSQNNIERVKTMLPDLNKAIHNLGALLFSIWWNGEEFSNHFTMDELYEMEQSVLSTFKDLGDISLDLMYRMKLDES